MGGDVFDVEDKTNYRKFSAGMIVIIISNKWSILSTKWNVPESVIQINFP